MAKYLFALFLSFSLLITSVMAVECCAEEGMHHVDAGSNGQQDQKALSGHHCGCQHVTAEPSVSATFSSIRTPAILLPIAPRSVGYVSLAHDPLLEPPLHA